MADLTIKHNGMTYANFTATSAHAAGIPQAVIDQALVEERLKVVKAECRKRIYSRASSETQMNMATTAAAIAGKAEAGRTKDEAAVLVGIKAALDWVGAMRAKCPDLAADPDTSFTQDASWPECPPEVVALVEQF